MLHFFYSVRYQSDNYSKFKTSFCPGRNNFPNAFFFIGSVFQSKLIAIAQASSQRKYVYGQLVDLKRTERVTTMIMIYKLEWLRLHCLPRHLNKHLSILCGQLHSL